MKLSEEERAANRAAFRTMSVGQKAEYIFAYYKLPLVLLLIAVVALGSVTRWVLTHKEPILYLAYANVAPSDRTHETLTRGFVEQTGASPRKSEVVCYRELYLSNDASQQNHQYAYASRLKVMAAVDAEQLDVVLMNQEAYDLLSAAGYLRDLSQDLASNQRLAALKDRLTSNTVVESDNSVEVELGEADTYEAKTHKDANALDVTATPVLAPLSAEGPLYLGIIANTPRLEASLAYLVYLPEA